VESGSARRSTGGALLPGKSSRLIAASVSAVTAVSSCTVLPCHPEHPICRSIFHAISPNACSTGSGPRRDLRKDQQPQRPATRRREVTAPLPGVGIKAPCETIDGERCSFSFPGASVAERAHQESSHPSAREQTKSPSSPVRGRIAA